MEYADYLIVTIEVSIALAGFAGIVVAFQYRNGSRVKRGEVLGLSLLVNNGLVCAGFAALPLALFGFGLADETVWQISSSLMLVNYVAFFYLVARQLTKVRLGNKRLKLFYISLYVPAIVIFLMNIMNILGIVFHQEFGPYFLALLQPLVLAGLMFAQLVMHPLWRDVKQYEEAKANGQLEK